MKAKIILTIIIAMAVVLPAHSQRKYNSNNGRSVVYSNADFTPRKFSKILVITASHDVDTNDKIAKEFSKIGVVSVNSFTLMPPVKDYTQDDFDRICDENNIDGIIELIVKGKHEKIGGLDPLNPLFESEIELTFLDREKNINAVKIVGTAEATDPNRTVLKFFKHVMPEIKPLVRKAI